MKHTVFCSLFFLCIIGFVFTACSKDKDKLPKPSSERTVLVYMVGKNDLSKLLYDDLEEIKEGYQILSDKINHNLLVFISTRYGRYRTPTLIKLEKDDRGEVYEKVLYQYDHVDFSSVNTEVMESVINQAFTNYPSKSYGLVMGSHADGWMPYPHIKDIAGRAFGDDNGRSINITDLAIVLEKVTRKVGTKLDYLLFDACLMQSVEVAYELKNSIKFLLGSPAEIPGPGGPYQELVPYLFDTTSNYNQKIIDSYFNYYNEKYQDGIENDNSNWTAGVALSSINVEYIEEYTQLTNQLLTSSLGRNEKINLDGLLHYDCRESHTNYYPWKAFYYDIYGLLQSVVKEENQELFNQWKAIHNEMVYYQHTPKVFTAYSSNLYSMEGSYGISLYIPRVGYEKMTEYYKNHTWYRVGGWADLGW